MSDAEWMCWRYSFAAGWSRFDPRTLVTPWDEDRGWLEQLGYSERTGSFDPMIWEIENARDYERRLVISIYSHMASRPLFPDFFVDTGDWELGEFFVDDMPSLLTLAPLMRALQETIDPTTAVATIMAAEYSSDDGKAARRAAESRRRALIRSTKKPQGGS